MTEQNIESITSDSEEMEEIDYPPFDDSPMGAYFSSFDSLKDTHQVREKGILSRIILGTIFQTQNFEQDAQIVFSNLKSSSKPVCGRSLTEKDIGFKCLDCQKDPTCVTCKDCFDNADHRGHRIIVQKTVSGCCDCGDPDAWAEAGFCKYHPGYANFQPNITIDDLPIELRINLEREISKALYFLALTLEKSSIDETPIAANPILADILSAIKYCGEQSIVVYSLVCNILRNPYRQDCRLYHQCDNLQEQEYSGNLKNCKCTLLEIIFRNQRYLNTADQGILDDFMIELFIDYDFKKYMAETFVKMLYFIYHQAELRAFNSELHLCTVGSQLFAAEEFAVIAIKSPYFPNLMGHFQLLTKNLSELVSKTERAFGVFMNLFQLLQYISQKSSTRLMIIQTEGFLDQLLSCIASLHHIVGFIPDEEFPLSFEELENNLNIVDIECNLVDYCDLIFREIHNIADPEARRKIYDTIGGRLRKILASSELKQEMARSFHIPVHRVLAHFIKVGAKSRRTEDTKQFILEKLGVENDNLSAFCLNIFSMVIKTYGFLRDQEKGCWETFGSRLEPYVKIYFTVPKTKFQDLDLFLMQTVARFIDHEQFYNAFLLNYSSYRPFHDVVLLLTNGTANQSLSEFIMKYEGEDRDKLLVKIEELVSLFLQLSIDEVPYANLQTKPDSLMPGIETDRFERLTDEQILIYRRLLINAFQYKSSFELKTLMNTLGAKILDRRLNLEVPLLDIADFDSTNKLFVIKPDYRDVYEPFACMGDPQLHIDIIDNLKSKFKSIAELDLIGGRKSYLYSDEGAKLFEIQKALFSKQFFEFFEKIFSIGVSLERTSSFFFRPFLKLFHLGLFHLSKGSLDFLRPILLDDEMIKLLESVAAVKSFTDYESSLHRMIKLVQMLKNDSLDGLEIGFDINESWNSGRATEVSMDEIKKKQLELKRKFEQKQKDFVQKHSNQIINLTNEEEKMDEEVLCYLCRGKIEEDAQAFGMPGFACCSNIHEIAAFQTSIRSILDETAPAIIGIFREEASKLDVKNEKFSNYMVLDSCHHNMHRDCFEKSLAAPKDTNFHFNNEIEFFCKVCKKLSNIFVDSYLTNRSKGKEKLSDGSEAPEIEETLTSIDSLLKCVQNMSKQKKNNELANDGAETAGKNTLFDTLIMLEIFTSESNGMNPKNNDDPILEVTERIFEYAIKSIDFIGVKHFLSKHLEVYVSLRGMYQRYYSNYASNTKKAFSRAKYDKILWFLELLRTGEVDFDFLTGTPQETKFTSFIATEIDGFIYNSIVHLAVTSQLSDFGASLSEVLSRLAFIMILNQMLRTYCIRVLKSDIFKSTELTTAKFFTELKENKSFRIDLAKALLPLIRRLVVLGCLLDPNVDHKEVKVFEQDQFYEDFEELESYLKHPLFKTNCSALMSEEILAKCFLTPVILELHFVKILELIQEEILSLPLTFMISNKEIAFHLIDLPDNFYDLSTLYMGRRCELCRDHSEIGNKSVCLICEQVLCCYLCKNNAESGSGNLNRHALKHHVGCSAFLSVENGSVFLINSPKNIDYGALYTDKYGQRFSSNKSKDWNSFSLDRKMLSKLKELIQSNSIPQEICSCIVRSEKKLIDAVL